MKIIFLTIILTSITFLSTVNAEKINIFDFTEKEFKTLQVKKVKGETTWSLSSNKMEILLKQKPKVRVLA